ncbi:PREDICTED: vacuolar protein sorting-associated protein 37D [Crocodylus porosus]|uniref:VPS37D subunit of ESCRT-I n=1 Tax=Crocodylus porosus TaxID=8502 RepID=A0A7M4EGY6_CROPO|nr:PREDICTED: vacuolar protein sorting-associated protein 37D [Crocodylus porosus]
MSRGSGSPARFGGLSTARLRALLQDEPQLQRMARLSAQFQSLQVEREMCLALNYTLAKENLSLQPQLENGKASLAIKYQELKEIREACQEKQQQVVACLEKWNPQSALTHLQADLDAAETESEVQIEKFLSQEMPLDVFLESFQQSRMLSHLRRTQVEKLQELLKKQQPPSLCSTRSKGQEPPSANPAPTHVALVQNKATPKMFQLRYSFTPAILVSSDAVSPFPMAVAPPSRNLPPLGPSAGQMPVSRAHPPRLCSPLRLIGHIPLLSPRPFRVEPSRLSCQQKQEPPHR